MNHLKQIAARLPEYGLDAMLLNSEPGEYYAVNRPHRLLGGNFQDPS